MSRLEDTYGSLPVWMQNLICSLEGSRINHRRYNLEFTKLLMDYRQRLDWSEDEVARWRDEQLCRFVTHSAATVPYYRHKFGEWGVKPEDIRALKDLTRLPILSKAEVQENLVELTCESRSYGRTMTIGTSGTTGTGLKFPATHSSQRHQWAVWWRYRLGLGLDLFEPCAVFGGRSIVPLSQQEPPFWRFNRPARQIMFSGYHMKPDNLNAYVDQIRESGARWLHGYPSHLSIVAAHILERGLDIGNRVRCITTGAESLLQNQKELLQATFGVPAREHYGLAEAAANISECPHGRLHVDEDFSAVEFVPIGDDCFSIVGTNFTNPAFPLIRYDTGDIARDLQPASVCECGRAGRVVGSIDGRKEDFILLKDGTRIGRMDHILKKMTHIREAQFYQKEPGRVQIRLVRGPEYSEADERWLLSEISRRLGEDTQLEIDYREKLERSRRGKLRLVISDIERAQLQPGKEDRPG